MTFLGRLRLRTRDEYLLLLAGINLMLLNFILVQHATIAFRQPEIAVIVFSLAYFSGVSAGYLLSDRISRRTVARLLPLFLASQMAMMVLLQSLHYVITDRVGPWAARHGLSDNTGAYCAGAVIFLLVAAGATSLYSIFLPLVVQGQPEGDGQRPIEGTSLSRGYSIEIAGSLIGLSSVPFLAAISHRALLLAYFASFLALTYFFADARRLRAVALPAVLVAGFLLGFNRWDASASAWFYRSYYDWKVTGVALIKYTPYHKIEILQSDDDYILVLNGKRQFGRDPRRTYSYFVAEYPARLLGAPKVALLGCGSMATVGRIGDFVPSVEIVDLDQEVFNASRTYFQKYNRLDQLHNWTFTADDAKHFVANSHDTFDLILHDIPPAKSRQIALTYTDEFFRLVKARLKPGGIFSISSLSPFVSRGSDSQYGKRMIATLASVFDSYFILMNHGSTYFYGGGPDMKRGDAATLLDAVDPSRRRETRVLLKDEVDQVIKGAGVITINNVGDLIYE